MTKTPGKKTLYVDVDEEITSIIDKVRTANESIIALVLPKRASMLQSIVNMKLLKRASDQQSKKVVLITTESTLMPLAGAAGLHVASSLQSRPFLPPSPESLKTDEEPDDIGHPEEDGDIDPTTPVGELANLPEEDKPIEIDNRPKEDESKTPAAAAAGAAGASKLGKAAGKGKGKLKVPNFTRFRKLMLLGGLALLLLLVGLYWAIFLAPKAVLTIRGDTNDVPLTLGIVADTEVEELDEEEGVVPARSEEARESNSEKVAATGQKDKGTKASGSMTFKNCSDDPVTIPAGTGVSSGGQTFITQASVRLDEGEFSSPGSGGQCRSNGDHTGNTNVIAQNNGDQYNLGPRAYTVSGFSRVTAQGSQMSGGSSNVVKVVSASDVESAKQKLTGKQEESKEELKKKLEDDDFIAIEESFSENQPRFNANPAVGSEANETTISYEVTYTMLGIKEKDLKKLVENEAKKQVDTNKQAILSDGLDEASFKIGDKEEDTTELEVQTKVVAGPEVDQDAIKKEIAGKKRGEAEQLLSGRSGYKEVRVDLKPFWVYSVPKKESKITIKVEQADGKQINP